MQAGGTRPPKPCSDPPRSVSPQPCPHATGAAVHGAGVSEPGLVWHSQGGGTAGHGCPNPSPPVPPSTFLAEVLREFLHFEEILVIDGGAGGGQRAQHVRLQHKQVDTWLSPGRGMGWAPPWQQH